MKGAKAAQELAAGGYAPFTLEDAITVLSEACK